MKKKIGFIISLCSLFLVFFSSFSIEEVQADTVESTWGTSPVTFDTDTKALTVQSGTIDFNPKNITASEIKHIIFEGQVYAPEYSNSLFAGDSLTGTFTGLESMSGNLDVSKVTDMTSMFANSKITSLDVSTWDVSKVTNMTSMFANSKITSLDVSTWDVSKVTDMTNMFLTSKITSLDVSTWDVSNVSSMYSMFAGTKMTNVMDLSTWDVSSVTNSGSMFSSSMFPAINVANWNTSNNTDMSSMFYNCVVTTLDFSSWDTSSVTSMTDMLNLSYINTLIMGKKSIFNQTVNLPNSAVSPSEYSYTERWNQIDANYSENTYPNSVTFMETYDGTYPGVYSRSKLKSLGENITVKFQDIDGNLLASTQTISGYTGDSYTTQQVTISGYSLKEIQGSESGTFSYKPQTVTYIYQKDGNSNLVPIWRAYNINDGDHLYTTSMDEYSWIVGLKWQAEGIAFQSVLSSYKNAIPIYRLYNSNSGEHFYTVSKSEYDDVAKKGWTKENIGFYMVSKNEGNPIYRVFNPNATGPGSHLFTESKDEANWLINQGWTNEGIGFYTPR